MSVRVKQIVSYVLDKLCAMTGHWRGCWMLDGPLSPLWYWSMGFTSRYWQRAYAIESERANRATSQIREALAILESGSDYEKMHIRGILEAGL